MYALAKAEKLKSVSMLQGLKTSYRGVVYSDLRPNSGSWDDRRHFPHVVIAFVSDGSSWLTANETQTKAIRTFKYPHGTETIPSSG